MSGGADGLAGSHAVRSPHVSELLARLLAERIVLPGEQKIKEREREGAARPAGGYDIPRNYATIAAAGVYVVDNKSHVLVVATGG